MLLWLAQFFQQDLGVLRVFSYISFRAVFATLTALSIGLAAGPAVIGLLTRLKVGQAVRTERSPDSSGQVRDPDDGGASDSDRHSRFNAVVVRSFKPVCLGCSDCHDGIWRQYRLG